LSRLGSSRLAVAAFVASVALPAAASAATLTVNTTTDETASGDHLCSLREAISAVDSPGAPGDCGPAGFGANTIMLVTGTYALTIQGAGAANNTGDLNLIGTVTDLTIEGAGTASTVIDATGLHDRVLNIASGASVTVSDLTLTGGHAPDGSPGPNGGNDLLTNGEGCGGDCGGDGGQGGAGGSGGAVDNAGSLTLSDAAVTNSSAGNGGAGGAGGVGDQGGVGGSGGPAGAGGGIYSTGILTLIGTTVSGNRGGAGGNGGAAGMTYDTNGAVGGGGSGFGDGGGIYNSGGTLTITGSTIDGNFAGNGGTGGAGGGSSGYTAGSGGNGGTASWGGGLVSNGGSLSVTNSTFAANHGGTGGNGGPGGTASISCTTCSDGIGGNGGTGGGAGDGGGVVSYRSSSLLVNATFAGNAVGSAGVGGSAGAGTAGSGTAGGGGTAAAGGGIFVQTGFCIVGHPCAGTTLQNTIVASNGGRNCSGAISDGGHNLSFGDTSCPGINGDPKLGSLGDDGGPTRTIPLLAGSAAFDQVPASGAGCPATDQRGVPRPQPAGGACDIGAYEFALPSCQPARAATGASQPVVVQLQCSDPAGAPLTYALDMKPSHGALTALDPVAGKVTYTPTAGYSGADSFTYHATSANGTTTVQTVSITVSQQARGRPPVITSARLTNKRFRVGPRATAISARKAPLGTTFVFTLSVPARLQITLTRDAAGLRRGRQCLSPTSKLKRAHAKRCRRLVIIGRLIRAAEPEGSDRVSFTGRLGAHALAPGAYQALLIANTGTATSTPVPLGFTVVR
jgi:CSLREA domain-containing protein